MKLSKFTTALVPALLSLTSLGAAAAAPQSGLWLIENGQNAYGGDAIQIDVQDNRVFIMFAAGAVPNNTFFIFGVGTLSQDTVTIDMLSSLDGSTKHVTATFDSSTHGTVNFPGVGLRTITRVRINDESKPESMYGAWNFSYISNATNIGVARARGFLQSLPATANGGGIAVDTTGNFGCEYQVSGSNVGKTLCVETSGTQIVAAFLLKRSVGEAAGVYSNTTSSNYTGFANRLSNKNGDALYLKSQKVPNPYLSSAIEHLAATMQFNID